MDHLVTVTAAGRGKFAVDIAVGPHHLVGDEPADLGGDDAGPSPHEFLLAGLGACTVMTLRMYAERKGIAVEGLKVEVSRRKIKATDCTDCATKEGEVEEISRLIRLPPGLDDATRQAPSGDRQ